MQNVMQALYLTRNARGLPASARRYILSYIAFPQVAENFFEKRREAEEKVVRYTITEA